MPNAFTQVSTPLLPSTPEPVRESATPDSWLETPTSVPSSLQDLLDNINWSSSGSSDTRDGSINLTTKMSASVDGDTDCQTCRNCGALNPPRRAAINPAAKYRMDRVCNWQQHPSHSSDGRSSTHFASLPSGLTLPRNVGSKTSLLSTNGHSKTYITHIGSEIEKRAKPGQVHQIATHGQHSSDKSVKHDVKHDQSGRRQSIDGKQDQSGRRQSIASNHSRKSHHSSKTYNDHRGSTSQHRRSSTVTRAHPSADKKHKDKSRKGLKGWACFL
ncbi:hypothetical protein S7711_11185 [Stachybotrys chartarum IBT 7711]|uniref:Uncharacterized protein n=1 Tax=Stachybotrys chartarum (strain CBS 109288 / IBT 7711) TaxID=1280523 RepID=A0A084AKW2_STACB|nr:hypothetical protein S7711_11185 [Stachybotrys chartarum IBT 7711]